MNEKVQIKVKPKQFDYDELNALSKEELIERIRSLHGHNEQLKNLLAKSSESKGGVQRKTQKAFDFSKCTFRRILLQFFYLGWDYNGYVVQEDTTNTIEHYLFEALVKTCLIRDRPSSNYHRCGRTDKGVSSNGQVISIDVRSKLSLQDQAKLDDELDYCNLLNRVLPDDIQCVAWCPVEAGTSARFDCKSRTYKYFFPKGHLNIESMQAASRKLLGAHDFRNLCKMDVGNGVVEFVRNIDYVCIEAISKGTDDNEFSMYCMTIKSKAFLWHQIRCIMGVLLLTGEGKERPEIVDELLDVSANPRFTNLAPYVHSNITTVQFCRKPEYGMASEVPLNLYSCEYDHENWRWSLKGVVEKLERRWTFLSVKATMVRSMLDDVRERVDDRASKSHHYLLQTVRSKTYVPLMKRQKCESLEDRICHFVKRSRIELKDGTSNG